MPSDGWTIDTAMEHLLTLIQANDARYMAAIAALKDAVGIALTSADRAVSKAEMAAEKRFEGVNEFRQTLADEQRTLMPRAEVEVIIRSLTEKVDTATRLVQTSLAQGTGHQTGARDALAYLAIVFGGLSLMTTLFLALSGHIH